ncbi:hypothetical protein DRP77_02540 [Candidatus Poribacteria bacterium]|nr:MAG: hypothetical protein DRP77_02540 [Candidatus Poribacteria bacterium]
MRRSMPRLEKRGRVKGFSKVYRDIGRYRQILKVLAKYGFDDLISSVKRRWRAPKGIKDLGRAERARLALQELGPTFIKLGQMLSMRPDLITPEFAEEFKKLQDEVPPCDFEEIKGVLEEELKAPLESKFSRFDPLPIAAASLAQVHKAEINGEPVAVKVQRPGIRRVIETDIDILLQIAGIVKRRLGDEAPFDPVGIVNEFAKSIYRELDFTREANNMLRFARNFQNDPTVYVPKVYWELTTRRVLTMEFVDGIKISDVERFESLGLDRRTVALNGAKAVLKEIFEHGFFHADPHPGNIFVIKGNVIVPVDFGMVGRLTSKEMESLGRLLTGMVYKDAGLIVRTLYQLGMLEETRDTDELERDISDFLDRYYKRPLYQLDMRAIMDELMWIVRSHRVKVPSSYTLMLRALVTMEGVGRLLDPQFDMFALAKPYVLRMTARKLSPSRLAKEAMELARDSLDLVRSLPIDARVISARLKKGNLRITVEWERLNIFLTELNRSVNRLTFGLITAALVVASAIVMHSSGGASTLGGIGLAISSILGLWLLITIIRSGGL